MLFVSGFQERLYLCGHTISNLSFAIMLMSSVADVHLVDAAPTSTCFCAFSLAMPIHTAELL